MKNLLLEGSAGFADSYMLLIVLVVIIVGFLLLSLSRRKKEENYRNDLINKVVPGAKVKTYSGLYCEVVSITDTTDGKIVLVKSGEGDKVSYQLLHINAIFGIDTHKDLVFDENGNDITFADADAVEEEEVEYIEVEEDDEDEEVEIVEVEEVEEEVIEEVVEEIEAPKAKKPASSAKKSTTKSTKSKSTTKK